MCLQNVNVTGNFFKKVSYENEVQKFEMPFDTIVAKTEGNSKYIDDFSIVLNFCLLGTTDPEKKKTNIIETRTPLNVLLRLSKVTTEPEQQKSLDLTDFIIDPNSNEIKVQKACVDYIICRKIFTVSRITIPNYLNLGEYVLKILAKTNKETTYNVQSYIPLRIE